MRSRVRTVVFAIGIWILVAACSSSGDTGQSVATVTPVQKGTGSYQTLTIDAFANILAKDKSRYTIINVHIPYEGEIEGTDAKIPYNDLNALMAALPNKDAPIILYCRSGRMSEIASRALIDKGYTQVWDVPGGMIAWQASGRAIVDK
jgi:phage shock protein E